VPTSCWITLPEINITGGVIPVTKVYTPVSIAHFTNGPGIVSAKATGIYAQGYIKTKALIKDKR
jgi:hypothetical protein